ncbi:VOC family protein [Mobilicoccus caccae]|nr:VOC family protein [Mobilicoccus caccae]
MRLSVVSIPVLDQDRALRFYRDHLGFGVHTDSPVDDAGNRWIALVAPEGTKDVHLLLEPADDDTAVLMARRHEQGIPTTVFGCDDIDRDYELLRAAQVVFTMEPTEMPYGGTDAVFEDSEGNLICLHQD